MLMNYFTALSGPILINLYFLLFFRDWHLVQNRIRDHPDFGHYFVEYPEDTTW